jgi:hypothetical protein
MMTREQRLKEREYKRLLHEEELANLSEDTKRLRPARRECRKGTSKPRWKRGRKSERLAEEDEWFFDCSVCGIHGET